MATETERKKEFYKICPNYNYTPLVLNSADKIVVIGDVHGDYNLVIRILSDSEMIILIDNRPTWIGGKNIVVQVGDQIDRCRIKYNSNCNNEGETLDDENSDIKILELFTELDNQAILKGGRVISLIGNHEIMNVLGLMHYVSYAGIEGFKTANMSGLENRRKLFSRGNKYAKFIGCTRTMYVIIGSFLFVHGAIVDDMLDKLNIKSRSDLDKIANIIRNWLLGNIENNKLIEDITKDTDISPFWRRILGRLPSDLPISNSSCKKYIKNTLKVLKINKMFIGHVPQRNGNKFAVTQTCGGQVWRVDAGNSKAFEKNAYNEIKYVIILNDKEVIVKTIYT